MLHGVGGVAHVEEREAAGARGEGRAGAVRGGADVRARHGFRVQEHGVVVIADVHRVEPHRARGHQRDVTEQDDPVGRAVERQRAVEHRVRGRREVANLEVLTRVARRVEPARAVLAAEGEIGVGADARDAIDPPRVRGVAHIQQVEMTDVGGDGHQVALPGDGPGAVAVGVVVGEEDGRRGIGDVPELHAVAQRCRHQVAVHGDVLVEGPLAAVQVLELGGGASGPGEAEDERGKGETVTHCGS